MPYQDLSVGSTANKPKSEPSFFDKVKDFFSGGDDKPSSSSQPVSGGRGRVVERPNERNDYLAKILSDNALIVSRFVSLVVIYFILVHIVGTPLPRYSVPLRPFIYGLFMLGVRLMVTEGLKYIQKIQIDT